MAVVGIGTNFKTGWVNQNISLNSESAGDSQGQSWVNNNIKIKTNFFTGTRFSLQEKGVDYNIPDTTFSPVKSFNYTDYNRDNLPTPPMYREIGKPLGENQALVQINSRLFDVARISQWMFTTGRGIKWVNEQIGLQMMNPKVETNLNVPFDANRFYFPGKTLSSVAFAGTGLKFQRSGLPGLEYRYESVIKTNNTLSEGISPFNRLYRLGQQMSLFNGGDYGYGGTKGIVLRAISGVGGPDSIFGLGVTLQRQSTTYGPFKDNSQNNINYPFSSEVEDFEKMESTNLQEIYKSGRINVTKPNSGPVVFPTAKLNDDSTKSGVIGAETPPMIIENFGQTNISSYLIKDYKQLNEIAKSVVQTGQNARRSDSYKTAKNTYLNSLFTDNEEKESGRTSDYYAHYSRYTDPFDSTLIDDPQYKGIQIKNLSTGAYSKFKAFIENISDSFSPKWSDVTYVGRPDTFRIYTGLTRSISLTFLIVSVRKEDKVWEKANKVAQFCSPSFNSAGQMISPVLQLNVLDLFSEVGYINSLTVGIEKEFPWDLNPKTEKFNSVDLKPMMCSIQLTFESMMDKIPSSTAEYYYQQPAEQKKELPSTQEQASGQKKEPGYYEPNPYDEPNYWQNRKK